MHTEAPSREGSPPVRAPRNSRARARLGGLALACAALGLSGCASLGPHALKADQVDYARALGDAKKREILATMVGLRFADAPAFLTVSQIIAAYSFDATAGSTLNSRPDPGGPLAEGTGMVSYSNHPTFTFTPTTGEAYASAYIRPLSPNLVLPLAATGIPIDLLLRISLQSIAGLNNAASLAGATGTGSPEFFEVLRLLRRLQLAGALTVQYRETNHVGHVFMSIGPPRGVSDEELGPALTRLRTLLHLASGARDYELVGDGAGDPGKISIEVRSMLTILGDIGAEIAVPAAAVASGSTQPAIGLVGGEARPIIIVHSGRRAPRDAYVATHYGVDYWIDQTDFDSKYAFTVIQDLMALAESTDTSKAPVVTIPAS